MWQVVRQVYALPWDGSNEADVLEMMQTLTPVSGNIWTIDSVDPGVALYLRETSGANPALTGLWPVQLDQVMIVAPDFGVLDRMPLERFNACYRVVNG